MKEESESENSGSEEEEEQEDSGSEDETEEKTNTESECKFLFSIYVAWSKILNSVDGNRPVYIDLALLKCIHTMDTSVSPMGIIGLKLHLCE